MEIYCGDGIIQANADVLNEFDIEDLKGMLYTKKANPMEINDAIIKKKLDALSEFSIEDLKGMLIMMDGVMEENKKLKEENEELKEELLEKAEESKILYNYREDMDKIQKHTENKIDDMVDVLPYIQKLEKANKMNNKFKNLYVEKSKALRMECKKMEEIIKLNNAS
tara:strand:- start:286 stop:786 length:501 start_codon:yes stop_codon:yes gene_type:complete